MGCALSKATARAEEPMTKPLSPLTIRRVATPELRPQNSPGASIRSVVIDDDGSSSPKMKPASGGILRALPGFRPLGDSSVAISPSVKRKGVTIIGNSPDVADAAAHGSLQRIVVKKTMDDKAFLVAALEANSLFAALSVQERTDIANAMELTTIPAGTTFISEGDSGDALYAIELGKLDIIKKGNVVTSWGDTADRRIVGELALLYGVPHSASVRAATNVRAWRIKHSDFQMTMAAGNFQRLQHIADILKKGLLADLDADQLHRVAAACEVVSYAKGVKIISKGDRGDEFYVIESGKVICRNLPGELRDNSLTAGDYFGERSLLKDEPRICDIWAAEDTSLIVLHRKDFTSLLGSLRATLEHNVGMRLLLCVPLFARLSADDLAAVFGKIRLLKFSKGSVILARGSSVTQILIIKEGRVEVKGVDQASPKAVEGLRNKVVKARSREVSPRLLDGVRVATSRPESARANDDILSEGQWFGEDEVDSAGPSPFTYTALEPVVAFSVDSDTYSLYLAPILRETRPSSSSATLGLKRDRVAKPADGPIELPPPRNRLGIPLREFEQRATLGTGTFGRVRIVYHRRSNRVFALKMLKKAQIVHLRQQSNIVNEKELLFRIDHPFIIKIFDTFNDRDRLYMLMDVVQGGELFNRLQTSSTPGRISVAEARFYAACVLDALAYLHTYSIVYRDLKPENVLIDAAGYIKLVDFGFAKCITDRSFTVCGTPEYLAPELLLSQGHDRGVDYWALGILLFEMVSGYSPFADEANADQVVICKNILRGSVEFPPHVRDKEIKELILRLLAREVPRRIGCLHGGAADVREHKFFQTIDWDELRARRLPTPWVPHLSSPLDTSNFDAYDENDDVEPFFDPQGDTWCATF